MAKWQQLTISKIARLEPEPLLYFFALYERPVSARVFSTGFFTTSKLASLKNSKAITAKQYVRAEQAANMLKATYTPILNLIALNSARGDDSLGEAVESPEFAAQYESLKQSIADELGEIFGDGFDVVEQKKKSGPVGLELLVEKTDREEVKKVPSRTKKEQLRAMTTDYAASKMPTDMRYGGNIIRVRRVGGTDGDPAWNISADFDKGEGGAGSGRSVFEVENVRVPQPYRYALHILQQKKEDKRRKRDADRGPSLPSGPKMLDPSELGKRRKPVPEMDRRQAINRKKAKTIEEARITVSPMWLRARNNGSVFKFWTWGWLIAQPLDENKYAQTEEEVMALKEPTRLTLLEPIPGVSPDSEAAFTGQPIKQWITSDPATKIEDLVEQGARWLLDNNPGRAKKVKGKKRPSIMRALGV